jgi:putative transposase
MRPTAVRQLANRINAHERAQILEVANSERYRNLPPTSIVSSLADEGLYLASESTFYRTLRFDGFDQSAVTGVPQFVI